MRRELSLRSSPSSGEVSTHSPACTSSPGLKRALDFKEEEQASGSNEKKMILAVEDDKVTLSEDSGEKALTPEDLINKVLMADEGDDKVTKKEEWEESVFRPSILANPPAGWSIDNETQNQESDVFLETLSSQEIEHARAPEDVDL